MQVHAGPSVAILTVVYNDLKGLQATCQSIQALTYPNLWHHIVDGASTDGTADWLKAENLPRTSFTSEPDKGLYDAMNKAMARAQEDFIWFINAGDYPATPDVLDKVFASGAEADLYYGDTELIDQQGHSLGLRSHKRLPGQLQRRHMRLGMVVSHQSMIVRRTLAPEFDIRYRIAADIDWTIRLLDTTAHTQNTGLILSRFESGGASTQHRRKSLLERWQIIRTHFGLLPALTAHAEITLRAVGRTLLRLPV